MKKVALIALKPSFFEDIKAGRKDVEFRRSFPANFRGDIYVYVTAPFSKVMAKFSAEKVYTFSAEGTSDEAFRWLDEADEDLKDWIAGAVVFGGKMHAIPISKFQLLDRCLTLGEFEASFGVKKRLRMPWNPAELIEDDFD